MQTFYMMVGLPGSGKSFTAGTLPDTIIHSSDAIRAEILGDENRQDQQELVFQTLHERVFRDLRNGKNVVYDATNTNYKRRMEFLQRVNAMRLPALQTVCVFMATPYDECVKRNKDRERTVPEHVICRMYKRFDVPMKAEGWDEIWIVDSKDFSDQVKNLMTRLSRLEHDNPHHTYTVGQHSMAAQMYLERHHKESDKCLTWATLLHDIGKEKTKVFQDSKGNPSGIAHFYYHENVGAYDSFCYTSSLDNDQRLKVALLIRWHMWPYVVNKSDNPSKTEGRIKRFLGDDIWKQIMVLNDCDRHAH